MVVGNKEKTDIEFEKKATLFIKGNKVKKKVYSDTEDRYRRDAFAPSDSGNLPNKIAVRWQGKRYKATLSFRTGSGGQSIPVYQWYVESRAEK
mgnify:CR=1 FL=1